MYHNKKGFTLIELIVVICIIGVLATILVPSAIGFVKKSKRTADIGTARDIYNDAGIVLAEGNDGYFSYISSGGSNTSVNATHNEETENYDIQVVCEHIANGGGNKWTSSNSQFDDFVKDMNKIEDGILPLKYFNPTGNAEETDKVEVWSADEAGNPCFRVWPETDDRYYKK